VKRKAPASTLKKVIVQTLDHKALRGYLNASQLGRLENLDLLTPEGSHQAIELRQVRCVYFVREFTDDFEPQRKAFLSRPKMDGLWVRLSFRDQDTLEGIVPNNLLELLDRGVNLTPPDLHGQILRIFVPRTALEELTVLGVVGVARRAPRRPAEADLARQPRLFSD
jgi:hypothetical protein